MALRGGVETGVFHFFHFINFAGAGRGEISKGSQSSQCRASEAGKVRAETPRKVLRIAHVKQRQTAVGQEKLRRVRGG